VNVSVVVPWRPGCAHRERAWQWVKARYAWEYPSWQVVLGDSPDGPFNRSAAILDGARKSDGDVVLVADGDVWVDPSRAVIEAEQSGWAIPHLMLHRLTEESSVKVLAGADWRGLPTSERPYRGFECGTVVAVRRDVIFDVPPDVRHRWWGQEDQCWALALRCLVGEPWRGVADCFHLWHPPQERMSRTFGTAEGKALLRRYEKARRFPALMRGLIDESKESQCPSSDSGSTT
jgi:hypothetical protein